MRFEGQVAVVTGAGRGIGRAIALRFASEGARVACVSRTEENAKKIGDEINGLQSESAKAYAVDVADHPAVQKIGARILEDFGRADILVNNAGVTRDALAMRMSLEDWDAVINTNAATLNGISGYFPLQYVQTNGVAGSARFWRLQTKEGGF